MTVEPNADELTTPEKVTMFNPNSGTTVAGSTEKAAPEELTVRISFPVAFPLSIVVNVTTSPGFAMSLLLVNVNGITPSSLEDATDLFGVNTIAVRIRTEKRAFKRTIGSAVPQKECLLLDDH